MIRRPPRSTLFPSRRSSDLARDVTAPPAPTQLAFLQQPENLLAGHQFSQAVKVRSEEHTSELQSRLHLVCRLLLEKKKHTVIEAPAAKKGQWQARRQAYRSP